MKDTFKRKLSKTILTVCLIAALLCTLIAMPACFIPKDGKSAYEIAVENGYAGTEQDWIESLNGKDGTDGAAWHTGTDAPDAAFGKDGDYYLNTSDLRLYRKENGEWQFIADLKAADCNHVFGVPTVVGVSQDGNYWLVEERCTADNCGYYITRQKPVEESVSSYIFEAKTGEALAALAQYGAECIFLSDGANIALTEDITADFVIKIAEGSEVSLDLNGHKLVSSYAGAFIRNYGTLTVDDKTGNGAAYTTDVAAQSRATLINYGTATINGGSFGSSQSRGQAFTNHGTATVNGGRFTACDNYVNTGYAYAIGNCADMTINDATVYGNMNGAIANDGGTMTVKGGTFNLGDGETANNYYMAYCSEGSMIIEGGTFTRNVQNDKGFIYSNGGTIELCGGSFEDKVNGDILIGGSYVTKISAPFGGCVFKVINSRVAVKNGITVSYSPSQTQMHEEESLFDGYIQYSNCAA